MFSWDSIESIVKTIFPLGMYEFEWIVVKKYNIDVFIVKSKKSLAF
jgi:hypothetical protein